VVRPEFLDDRLPGLAAGHDRKAVAHGAGLQDRRISHADHGHGADLFQGREAGIAEAGQHDGVLAALVVGQRVEGGVAGDGLGGARGDVARPERTGYGPQPGCRPGEAAMLPTV